MICFGIEIDINGITESTESIGRENKGRAISKQGTEIEIERQYLPFSKKRTEGEMV